MTGEEMLEHLRMLDKKYNSRSRKASNSKDFSECRQMSWACRFSIEEIEKEMRRELALHKSASSYPRGEE